MAIRTERSNLFVVLGIIALISITFFAANVVVSISAKYALGAAFGVTLFIVSFLNTQAALYILIFSMMLSPEFGSRTTAGGGMTIRLDDFFLVVIGFTWLAKSALYKELGLFLKTPLNRPIFYYTLACIFSTGIGMMFGRVKGVTGFFFVLKYIEYFIVYFMAINNIHTKRQIQFFVWAMLATCFVVCLISISQIPGGGRVTAPFEGEGGEPNTLGGYLLLMLSIVLGLLLTSEPSRPRRYTHLLIGLSGLIMLPLLYTQSRGSWVAFVPMYFAFMLLSEKRTLLVLALVAMVLLGPVIAPQAVKDRIAHTFRRERGYAARFQETMAGITLDTSASDRVRSWREGLKASTKHILIGHGVTGWRFLDAQYIRVLVETGLFGLAMFSFMIFVLLRETWQTFRRTEDRFFKGLSLGFLAGIVAMLTHGVFANTFIIVRIMEPFWFLAAMVVTIGSGRLVDGPTQDVEKVPSSP